MESDIVTRLELWCNWHDAGFYKEIRNEIRQAIDEIERLRKERDELAHRIATAAPNDAIRMNGPSMLRHFDGKIADAMKMVNG